MHRLKGLVSCKFKLDPFWGCFLTPMPIFSPIFSPCKAEFLISYSFTDHRFWITITHMQQQNVDWSSDLSFVYFWVCVKVIQGTEKLRTTQEHYMYSVSQAGWSCEHLEFELAVECLNPVGTFMWNELGKPHMHLTPSFTCLVRLPGFLLYIFLSSLWQYNKWKRTWNRPVCLYTWNSNMCSYIASWLYFYLFLCRSSG